MKNFLGSVNSCKIKEQSYNEYLFKQKSYYINKSKEIESKVKDFKSKIKVLDLSKNNLNKK